MIIYMTGVKASIQFEDINKADSEYTLHCSELNLMFNT